MKREMTRIVEEINSLRKELEDCLEQEYDPTESQVVKISEELDKLIVEFYKDNDNQ